MNANNARLDEWLKQALDEPTLTDGGFSLRTMQLIERHLIRRRRILFGSTGGATGVIAALLLALEPAALAGAMGEPVTALSALALLGLWGACWISTESLSGSLRAVR